MADRLNIALVGATGKVAALAHLSALMQLSNASLYAVCDIDPDGVGELADRTGSLAHTYFEEVLADPHVDAIDLVTPPFLHADQTISAAQACLLRKADGAFALRSHSNGSGAPRSWDHAHGG